MNINVKVIAKDFEKYLNKTKPCIKDTKNDFIKSGTWKIQLTITINFISSKNDNDDERKMHST